VPTVLVADDNSNIQKMVALALEDHGIKVIAVGNGEAAVRKLPDANPDVVLADVFMPVRNGYEVCEFIKKDPHYAHIPVVLLIGAFDPLDEKEVHRVGANGILKKPFVPPDPLIAMVTGFVAGVEKRQAAPAAGAPDPIQEPAPIRQVKVELQPEAEVQPKEFPGMSGALSFREEQSPAVEHAEEPVPEWRREPIAFDVPAGLGVSANLMDESESSPASYSSQAVAPPSEEAINSAPAIPATTELAAGPAEWLDMMSAHKQEPEEKAAGEISVTPSEDFVPETPGEDAAPTSAVSLEAPPDMLWQPAAVIPRHTEQETKSPASARPADGVPPQEIPPPSLPSDFDAASFLSPAFVEDAAAHPSAFPPSAETESDAFAFGHSESDIPTDFSSTPVGSIPAPPQVDRAIVEAVVSQVLERLEPQIHDILTREILRPLAESLLHQELQKK
jgi:CheY-like chemotaxis protein